MGIREDLQALRLLRAFHEDRRPWSALSDPGLRGIASAVGWEGYDRAGPDWSCL